jgi:hypothetical protein
MKFVAKIDPVIVINVNFKAVKKPRLAKWEVGVSFFCDMSKQS